MFFRQLLHEEKACLSYIVGCLSKGVAAVIDPQQDIQPYLHITTQNHLNITHIIETHVQADHYSGAEALSKTVSAPIYFHRNAPVTFDYQKLKENDVLTIGNRRIRVIHTPGHTDESITLFVDDWFLLTGDTLFVGDVGRVDLSLKTNSIDVREKAKKLYDSLFNKLLKLPDYIEIYPGHYSGSLCGKSLDGKPSSTIGREKRFNHTLQFSSDEDAFIKLMMTDAPPPPLYRKIKRKNLGLRSY